MKSTLLTATSFALAVTTTSVHAEEQPTQTQLACATVTLCQEMSAVIQAQIQELETKDTLTTEDKKLRYQLKKRLIALEFSETKQIEQTNEELAELNSQLSALRGILLDK